LRARHASILTAVLSVPLAAAAAAQCPEPSGNAHLALTGEARIGSAQDVSLGGRSGSAFAISVDAARGPLQLPWGTICQGPGLAVLFAGNLGASGFHAALPLPAAPAWIGRTLYFQGFVVDAAAPNGALAISQGVARTLYGPSPWTWPNGPSSSTAFFPLGVWLQAPSRAAQLRRDLGINTFVGLWTGPSEANLAALAQAGMPVYDTQTASALQSPNAPIVHAWRQQDEPDNAQPNPAGGYLPCIDPAEIQRIYREWKAADPTRPVHVNFGMGAAYTSYTGRGVCTGQTWMYPEYIKGADIVSFDIFPATSSRAAVQGKFEYIAIGLQNLTEWIAASHSGPKILMSFVGTTNVNSTTLSTSPEQIKSSAWMSIIHGATGLLYFIHELAPQFREDGIYNHPENVAAVAQTNALVTELAAVLNAPAQSGTVNVESQGLIHTLVKQHDGRTYVFAIEMAGARPVAATFRVAGTPSATVRDLEEGGRALAFADGQFADVFDGEGYDAHVYEITPR
jgi:hypothetical protein